MCIYEIKAQWWVDFKAQHPLAHFHVACTVCRLLYIVPLTPFPSPSLPPFTQSRCVQAGLGGALYLLAVSGGWLELDLGVDPPKGFSELPATVPVLFAFTPEGTSLWNTSLHIVFLSLLSFLAHLK